MEKNLKNHEIGAALLGLSVPILTKSSEKAISSWLTKRAHNLKVRQQRAGRGEADEGDEPEPAVDDAVHNFDNPTFEPETLFQGQEPGGELRFTGEYEGGEPVRAGEIQGIQEDVIDPGLEARGAMGEEGGFEPQGFNVARAFQGTQAQTTQAAAPQLEAAANQAGQDATEAVATAGDEGTAAAIAGGTEVLTAETSFLPELSSVIAVGGLIASGVVSLIDIFKNSHEPPRLEALPQIGI
jgi:hypothetical protein